MSTAGEMLLEVALRKQTRWRAALRGGRLRMSGMSHISMSWIAGRVVFVALLLLLTAEPAASSELATLAASMRPGDWRQFNTSNLAAVSQLLSRGFGYEDSQSTWDSTARVWR